MALPATPQRIIVLVPTRGTVSAELLSAFVSNTGGYEIILRMVNRLPVDVARNQLAAMAIDAADDIALFSRADDPYVFWIDSDAFFINGTFALMIDALEKNPSIALLAALFGPRAADRGATAFRIAHDRKSYLVPDVNFKRGELVDVEVVGMHLVLHRVSLLRSVGKDPFGRADDGMSDDSAFCGRVRMVGGRIAVATGIPAFHVDERNGAGYTPGIPACVIDGAHISTTAIAEELPTESRSYGEKIDAVMRAQDLAPIEIAVALLSRADGRTLVVRKRGTATFIQPGGKLEPNEHPVDALCRELEEELGLHVTAADLTFAGTFHGPAVNEAGTVTAHAFRLTAGTAVTAAAEIEELAWIDPAQPGDIILAPLTRDEFLPLLF